jgi:glycosyltransferase involved in cell wall biosynthesis
LVTAHLGDVPGGVPEKTGRWFRLVYRWTHGIWRNASAVVAVSEHTRQLALRHYPVSIEVIPNGVELKSIPAGEPPVGDPPRLIFAGRFQPQKNLPMLVRSLAAIKDLEWMCELVGDGPQATLVDRMLRELGLDQRVERTGWIDPAEVEARMHQSDILVMPSRSEGLPVIGIQALAAGLAIVATRVGGLTELVEDGVNGRSSDPGNEADFIEGLRWCLENRRRLSGLKRASRRKAAAYDLDTVAERYEQVLARVAG